MQRRLFFSVFNAVFILSFIISGLLLFLIGPAVSSADDFPQKALTLAVHSKAGSGIDLMCRKIAALSALKNYFPHPVVVENYTGGGGNIAMQKVNSRPADGYTLLAVTKSFISTSLLSKNNLSLPDFDLLACLVSDPEALIVNSGSLIKDFNDLKKDALEKRGNQKWIGPFVGGTDHLTAVKIMLKSGINARWIPYDTGSEAIAGIMGMHGSVYVGNPVDIKGRPALKIIALASDKRLDSFPDVPTLKELGCDLTEDLWRGFCMKKGVSLKARQYIINFLQKISLDPEWRQFILDSSARPVFITGDEFAKKITRESQEAEQAMIHAGIISKSQASDSLSFNGAKDGGNINFLHKTWFLCFAAPLFCGIYLFFKRPGFSGEGVLGMFFVGLGAAFYNLALLFPKGKLSASTGPAAAPLMWAFLIMLFALVLSVKNLARAFKKSPDRAGACPEPEAGQSSGTGISGSDISGSGVRLVLIYCAAMLMYIYLLNITGYFIATAIFMPPAIYSLGFKKKKIIVITTCAYLFFAWFTFIKALGVPLPTGLF